MLVICDAPIEYLWRAAAKAINVVERQLALSSGPTLSQKRLQIVSFYEPRCARFVSNQSFTLNPSKHGLAVDAQRIGSLPRGINPVLLDQVR